MDNIFKEAHGTLNNTYIPVTLFDGELEKNLGIKFNYKKHVDVLKERVPHLINDIYFLPNQVFSHFVYYKDFVFIDVHSLEWEIWEQFHTQERIEHWIEQMAEYQKEKNYEMIFGVMEKRILITEYIRVFKKIPFKQKYNCFRDLWRRSEYGFDLFEPAFLKEVFAYREQSEERREDMEQFIEDTEGKKIITIYRGVTDKSTPVDKAISWTLDEGVANFFAKRFRSNGNIYKAEIDIEYVYDYLTGRNEKELLINPKGLMNVELHK